jgi:hypothetical protein
MFRILTVRMVLVVQERRMGGEADGRGALE